LIEFLLQDRYDLKSFFPFQLKTARDAVQFGIGGSALGALFTAGYAWKYSRSLHGNLPFVMLLKFFYTSLCFCVGLNLISLQAKTGTILALFLTLNMVYTLNWFYNILYKKF